MSNVLGLRGLCPACGRTLYLTNGLLPVHSHVYGWNCAGSNQEPWPGALLVPPPGPTP